MKGIHRQQPNFFTFNKLCRCCLQQWDLAIRVYKATMVLTTRLGCSRISTGLLRANTQWDIIQSWSSRLHLVRRDGSISPIIWQFCLDCIPMFEYFQYSTVLDLNTTPQMALNVSCPSLYSIPSYPLSPSPSSPDLLIPVPSSIHTYLF